MSFKMKVDFRHILIVAFMWLLSVLLLMWVFSLQSCSDARLAQKHYKKAVKHGYRCDTISDTVTIEKVDSFQVIKNDTIVWQYYITKHDTIIKYKTSYVPKTRWQTRIEYKHDTKRFKALLKQNRYLVSQQQKQAVKMAKIKSKENPLRQIKGLIVWAVILTILVLALKWFKK